MEQNTAFPRSKEEKDNWERGVIMGQKDQDKEIQTNKTK